MFVDTPANDWTAATPVANKYIVHKIKHIAIQSL